jgi:hypothetical protein
LSISSVAADPALHLRDVGLDLPRVGSGDLEQAARQRLDRRIGAAGPKCSLEPSAMIASIESTFSRVLP